MHNFGRKHRFMKIFLSLILTVSSISLLAQQEIRGTISDRKGQAVAFANVYLEGSYDGCTSDTLGRFSMTTSLKGRQVVVASFILQRKMSKREVV